MASLPTTRAEAQALGAPQYFTGLPCKRGHIAPRETKGNCTECRREDTLAAADTRREYFRDYNRREDVKERKHEWYANNSQAVADGPLVALTRRNASTVMRGKLVIRPKSARIRKTAAASTGTQLPRGLLVSRNPPCANCIRRL